MCSLFVLDVLKVKRLSSLHPQDQNLVRSKEEVDTFWSWVKMLWSWRSHSIKEER